MRQIPWILNSERDVRTSSSLCPSVDVNSVFPLFLCLFVPPPNFILMHLPPFRCALIPHRPDLLLSSCPSSRIPHSPSFCFSCLVFHLSSYSTSLDSLFLLNSAFGLVYLFVCVLACIFVPLFLVFCVASFYGRTLIILTFSTSNRSSRAAARLRSSSSSSRSLSLLRNSKPILEATRWSHHNHHSPNSLNSPSSHSSRWQLWLQTPNQGQVCPERFFCP